MYAAVIYVAFFQSNYPASTRHWDSVGLMLGQRRRRWANIKPTLSQCIVLAGYQATISEGVKTLNLSNQPLFHWPKHSSDRRSRWYLGQCTPKKIYELTWWWWLDDYSGLTAPNSGISVRTKLILTGSHTSKANCRPTCYSACNCSLSFDALKSFGNIGSIILQTQNQVN